ncbi:MAG: DUF4252 domain-containing protein [Lysobacterales bacterium]|jgi:hypothetical protein
MKTGMISKWVTLCLTALLALPAMAQEDALKDYPGYVDFGELGSLFGEPTVQIAVGQSLLNMLGSLSAEDDPEAAALFKKLNGVRVNVFETDALVEGAVDLVKQISSNLSSRGWESVVTVNSDDEQVRIFMKIADDHVQGITVMALEEDEAVFVNIIGDLKPSELEKVMDNFDVNINGAGHSKTETRDDSDGDDN